MSETWLNSVDRLSNSMFKCYRLDRDERSGGGVAVFIKRSIQHKVIPVICTKLIETIGI